MKIRVKAKEKEGLVVVKCLIKHPMETGRRKDKDGKKIPEHHLTNITIHYNHKIVFDAEMGTGVSKDPYLSMAFKGKKGEHFEIHAQDNQAHSEKKIITIK
jgi:sulfur-oxidizing protein SoxZ